VTRCTLITMRTRALLAGIGIVLVPALAGCGSDGVGQVPTGSTAVSAPVKVSSGRLAVEEVAGGLSHGWDIGFLPDGKVLVTQRPAKIALMSSTRPGASVTEVAMDLSSVQVRGEGGLMGMVVHPDFGTSRQFTTCQTHQEGGRPVDIRLITWRLADDGASAAKVRDLLTGLPLNASGRHSGCRPTIAADGTLLVGTGDVARPANSQDMTSLGGKVLRLDLKTGAAPADNPFADSPEPRTKLVYTFGHRNVQGVAIRPGDGRVFTAEHGPEQNDEVNLLRAGANYGWDPAKGGTEDSYDESVPMTDLRRFPDAVAAKWQSGPTTEAVCAAEFLAGAHWGDLQGALVVTALKGAKLLLLRLDADGDVTSVSVPSEFDDTFGRLRAARTGPDGALYVTTTNGADDKLLRVTPE